MKRKLVILFGVFVLSALAVLLGSFFKIQHWSGGSELLLVGLGGQLAAGIGLVVVLVQGFVLNR